MNSASGITSDAELLRQLRAHPHRVAVALWLLRAWARNPDSPWHEQLRQVAREIMEDG